jgi:Ca-activated chloride channel family protein
LYPIPPSATRRVRVRYSQWLAPDAQGRRTYRLPIAALETRIGELRADFDLDDARAARVRSGAGARVEDAHLYVAQSDVLPRADLVVELEGAAPDEASAVRVAAPAGAADTRGSYLRVAVPLPAAAAREARDEGVDLVIVVDHSAATDDAALRLEQAFVESLVTGLDARDQVLVLAGDVATRPVGTTDAALQPATAETKRAIIEALGRDRLGGATDLGAMVAAAHAALRPGRNGAVVYVGDGNATVGEAQLPGLRQALARLSPRPLFYAVAVGEDPRLDLLHGLAEPAGLAARVARRGEVARTALELLEHASRPLVRGFRVALGPSVTAVYPSEPVDLPAGEPLVVVGRFTAEPPRAIQVRASYQGAEVTRTLPLEVGALDDGGDLRFRWANARLSHLMARGESRPVIVELGTRYGLITPFTSLYVPSEDEVSAREPARATPRAPRLADLGVADVLPLFGCARAEPSRATADRKSTRLNSSHNPASRMPSSA